MIAIVNTLFSVILASAFNTISAINWHYNPKHMFKSISLNSLAPSRSVINKQSKNSAASSTARSIRVSPQPYTSALHNQNVTSIFSSAASSKSSGNLPAPVNSFPLAGIYKPTCTEEPFSPFHSDVLDIAVQTNVATIITLLCTGFANGKNVASLKLLAIVCSPATLVLVASALYQLFLMSSTIMDSTNTGLLLAQCVITMTFTAVYFYVNKPATTNYGEPLSLDSDSYVPTTVEFSETALYYPIAPKNLWYESSCLVISLHNQLDVYSNFLKSIERYTSMAMVSSFDECYTHLHATNCPKCIAESIISTVTSLEIEWTAPMEVENDLPALYCPDETYCSTEAIPTESNEANQLEDLDLGVSYTNRELVLAKSEFNKAFNNNDSLDNISDATFGYNSCSSTASSTDSMANIDSVSFSAPPLDDLEKPTWIQQEEPHLEESNLKSLLNSIIRELETYYEVNRGYYYLIKTDGVYRRHISVCEEFTNQLYELFEKNMISLYHDPQISRKESVAMFEASKRFIAAQEKEADRIRLSAVDVSNNVIETCQSRADSFKSSFSELYSMARDIDSLPYWETYDFLVKCQEEVHAKGAALSASTTTIYEAWQVIRTQLCDEAITAQLPKLLNELKNDFFKCVSIYTN